ncbi:hypothetical protein GCM10029976_078300 [Kribbella albertanoniae]
MALFSKGSELDTWAKALGATNDDAAAQALYRHLVSLEDGLHLTQQSAQVLRSAPDTATPDALASAIREINTAAEVLASMVLRFKRHERGRS